MRRHVSWNARLGTAMLDLASIAAPDRSIFDTYADTCADAWAAATGEPPDRQMMCIGYQWAAVYTVTQMIECSRRALTELERIAP